MGRRRPGCLASGALGEVGVQWILFCTIGLLNTGLHFAAYQLLLTLGIDYLVASGGGYCLGLANSYVLNRRFTFRRSVARRWRPEFLRFVVVNLVALSVNLGLLRAIVAAGLLGPRLAVVPGIFGSLLVNFLGNKLWTFRGDAVRVEAAELERR